MRNELFIFIYLLLAWVLSLVWIGSCPSITVLHLMFITVSRSFPDASALSTGCLQPEVKPEHNQIIQIFCNEHIIRLLVLITKGPLVTPTKRI